MLDIASGLGFRVIFTVACRNFVQGMMLLEDILRTTAMQGIQRNAIASFKKTGLRGDDIDTVTTQASNPKP